MGNSVIIASETVVFLNSKCSQEEVSSVKKESRSRLTAGTARVLGNSRGLENYGSS